MKEIIQEVVQKKYKYFYHYALKLTCNIEEAQDIAQEAILNALSKYNQFSGNEKDCEKWITTIIRNLFINKYRQESNKSTMKKIKSSSRIDVKVKRGCGQVNTKT